MEFSFQFPPPSKFHAARNFDSPAFRSCKILLEFCLTKKGSPPSKLFQQFRFPCVSFPQNSIGILSHENAGDTLANGVLFPRCFWRQENERSNIFGRQNAGEDSLPERAKRRGRNYFSDFFFFNNLSFIISFLISSRTSFVENTTCSFLKRRIVTPYTSNTSALSIS